MIEYDFYLPRNKAKDVRDQLKRSRLKERMRLREAVGYLPGDRDALTTAPAADQPPGKYTVTVCR